MWEFLLWIREVNEIVKEKKVTMFMHTFQMQTKKAKVGQTIVDFSIGTIAKVFKLPTCGVTMVGLPYLTREEGKGIFECRINWVRDGKWNVEGTKHHWKGWFNQ